MSLTTKTGIDSPDLTGACATEQRRAVVAAVASDALSEARRHLDAGGPGAASEALAVLIEADARLVRLGVRA